MYGKKNHSKSINNATNAYTRPNYFGSGKDSAENSYSRISQAVNAMDKSKKKNTNVNITSDNIRHGKSRQKQISSNTEIIKMRKDLQILGQLANNNKTLIEFVPYRKTVRFEQNAEINNSQLINVSPIYTKRNANRQKNQQNQPNLNDKLDVLIRGLKAITDNQYFSPGLSQSILQKKETLSSKKSVRLQSKSLNSKKGKPKQDILSNQFDLLKKPTKSIFLMSDFSHESSRVFINNFMEGSSRSIQKTDRIMPTSRQTRTGSSSIQYYLLQQKLQKKQPLQLEIISSTHQHRSKITSVINFQSTQEIFSASLDYSVVKTYQDQSQILYKHRGGVECAIKIQDLLVTGGRDCYLRSNQDWSRKMPASITQLVTCNPETLLGKCRSLFEFDLEKLKGNQICDLGENQFLLQKDQINGCLIGNPSSLSIFDRRRQQPQRLFTLKDNIKFWKILKDKVIGVGKYVWMGGITGLQKVCPFNEEADITSICDYHSSYLIGLSEGAVVLFQNDLRVMAQIPTKPSISLFGLKNKVACGYLNGQLDFCIVK